MIPIPRATVLTDPPRVKLIGVGGAGSSALDRVFLDGAAHLDFAAMNTDVQALTACVAPQKLQLGQEITRGLGTGGDPEIGYTAAEEASDAINELLGESKIVIICAGLGGGTGSGAAPVATKLAKERGALTIVIATMPFTFEGKRRITQAQESLRAIEEWADAVICFENDRMGDSVSPSAGIHHAFVSADHTISQAVRSLIDLLTKPGLLRAGFDDVVAVLRNNDSRSLFGFGESSSDNRANEAVSLALKNPLMDKGRMLAEASSVLVHVIGGNTLTLYEVQIVMEELSRHIDDSTQILFGLSVDAKWGNRLSITLLTSLSGDGRKRILPAVVSAERLVGVATPPAVVEQAAQIPIFAPTPVAAIASPEEIELIPGIEPQALSSPVLIQETPPPEPAKAESSVQPVASVPVKPPRDEKTPTARQETLPFEAATRGRFDKSEPTIIDGQDLDIPTFLRKKIKLR